MKAIVLAEKPSVGKEIARVLNCAPKSRSYCEGPRYIVTWALGHLIELAEPEDYDPQWKAWKMEHLPMLPDKMKLNIMGKTSQQFKAVSHLLQRKDVNEVIIATDAGREGELVARWILLKADWHGPIKRLWISSQTEAAIKDGFAQLRPGQNYLNLYQAAQCRAEADWIVGLNVTRALTCKFDMSFNAGRVQTPTLAMIVQREQEIKHFKPVEYWTVQANFGDYVGQWRDAKGQARIFEPAAVDKLAAKLRGQRGVVSEMNISSKAKQPPLAYDLTELQRDANRVFGFSAKKTLSIIQSLYETHKIVTYPRTDSRYITRDMVATLPQRLKANLNGPYQSFIKTLLQKPLTPGARFVDDAKVSDHHAIIPTEQPYSPAALSFEEKQIHDLIVERFVAVLYPPYRYDQIQVVIDVAGEIFHSNGTLLKDKGWRAVTEELTDEDEEAEDRLPDQKLGNLKRGQTVIVQNVKQNLAHTGPPKRHTEATLLTAMEKPGKYITDEKLRESLSESGLGTPATRAEIIEKLVSNFYMERQGKSLAPTDKGFQLIHLAPEQLKSPALTAQWEYRLKRIEKGQESPQKFIVDIRENAKSLVRAVKADETKLDLSASSLGLCPVCGKPMMSLQVKNRKKIVCSDKRCGYEESADPFGEWGKRKSGKERAMNQRLIAEYSADAKGGSNLGDLLKEALAKKKEK